MKVHRTRIGILVLLVVFGLCCAGVALAQHHGGTLGGPRHGKGPWSSLTEEQREAVHALVTEMREGGATREEIHTAVTELLKSYGVKPAEDPGSTASPVKTAESHITSRSHPNPLNPQTQITYALDVSEDVKVRIYDVTGKLVRTFDEGHRSAGTYAVRWDGRREDGNPASSGVYFYRIEAGSHTLTDRIVLVK